MPTLRLLYTKSGYMKFLGHLELMKCFERTFRLHQWPLKFSEGFNPHPKMTFASPLSVGYESQYEVMEVELKNEWAISELKKINFPEGIEIKEARYVSHKTSLMGSVAYSEYLIKMEYDDKPIFASNIRDLLDSFVGQDEINYEKKSKRGKVRHINAKEQMLKCSHVFSDNQEIIIRATLQTSSQGNLKPELLARLFAQYLGNEEQLTGIRVERLMLFYQDEKTQEISPLFDMLDD